LIPKSKTVQLHRRPFRGALPHLLPEAGLAHVVCILLSVGGLAWLGGSLFSTWISSSYPLQEPSHASRLITGLEIGDEQSEAIGKPCTELF